MQNFDPLFLEMDVACSILGLKRTKFFAACRDKELDRVKQGRKTLVTMQSVRRYAEKLMLQLASSNAAPALDDMDKQPPRTMRCRKPTPAQKKAAAAPMEVAAGVNSSCSQPATESTDFDDSWLTLAGVADEQW